ncbi:MAG: M23 family metallopeptidase [Bacilli bacterium]|nr:M23 family metallopeptidase [Bacilli bacterium]
MFLSVCSNPDILSIMKIINMVIMVIKILVPVIIIITGIISFAKAVMNEDDNQIKNAAGLLFVKFLVGACVFFVPTFVGAFINIAAPNSDYMICFNNASEETIKKAYLDIAIAAVASAERTADYDDYSSALSAVAKLDNSTEKTNLSKRLELVNSTIEKEREENIREKEEQWQKDYEEYEKNNPDKKDLEVSGSYASAGNGVAQAGVYQNSEPDPSSAINYWAGRGMLIADNFIYPSDKATGLPLGAWPKNYGSITTQLSGYKVYSGGLIWPCTPTNSNYHFVYQHNGIDIMATVGTPIYAPVDGILEYSEWGHTVNRGGDETAYTVSIKLSNPITVQGKTITNVFMTHMSGIVYRCARGTCNRTVQKGELLGFVGNAAGSAQSVGWAPHLHMTYYSGSYENGFYTKATETLYGIPNGTSSYNIVAGG